MKRRVRVGAKMKITPSSIRPVVLIGMFFFAVIGVVSPFALGKSADIGASGSGGRTTATTQILQPKSPTTSSIPQAPLFQRPSKVLPLTTVSSSSSSVSSTEFETKKRTSSRIRRFVSNFNPSPGKQSGKWKGGESQATFASRLLFTYVGPLLDLAKERNLSEEDCLDVAPSLKMDSSVNALEACYATAKRKSQKKIEEQRLKGNDVVKKSQTKLLFKVRRYFFSFSTIVCCLF